MDKPDSKAQIECITIINQFVAKLEMGISCLIKERKNEVLEYIVNEAP